MSSILKYSSIKEDDVRVIDGDAIVAKKLEHIVDVVKSSEDDNFSDSFSEGIKAADVAKLIEDDPNGSRVIEPADKSDVKGDKKADIQAINHEASEILENANKEAEGILNYAKKDAEEIKEKARKEGYSKGFEEGMKAGEATLAEKAAELEELKKQLEKDYQAKIEELEPQLVEAITGVYEYIFQVDLVEDREIVVHLVNSAMAGLNVNSRKFRILVSSEDYAYISMQKKTVLNGTGINPDTVEFVEDSALPKGQCMIETDNGIYDCSLQTQLGNLKKDLVLLSYQKE